MVPVSNNYLRIGVSNTFFVTQLITDIIIVIVPYERNESFVGRVSILEELKRLIKSTPAHTRAALYGLGGIG